jgi:hypothetical protein
MYHDRRIPSFWYQSSEWKPRENPRDHDVEFRAALCNHVVVNEAPSPPVRYLFELAKGVLTAHPQLNAVCGRQFPDGIVYE